MPGSEHKPPAASRTKAADQEHYAREDHRWSTPAVRSWLILGTMITAYLIWTGIVYFFEPGIR